MKKKLIELLVIFTMMEFIFYGFARAADLNVDCPAPSKSCSKTGTDPLFSTEVDGFWYPGRLISKSVNIKNSSPELKEIAIAGVRTSPVSGLENVMQISITAGGIVFWSGSLSEFYKKEKISLGYLNYGTSSNYNFTISLNSNTDDSYKGSKTVFDLTIGFWTQSSLTENTGGTSGGGNTSQTSSVVFCSDSKPGIITNFSAVSGPGVNQISLSWTNPAEQFTYILIAYSDNNTVPKWGNPNIGKTSSYIVSDLNKGDYWFWVRAGNGCTPGDFTAPLKVTILGQTINAVPAGFESILGVKIPGEIVEAQATSEGKIVPSNFFQELWNLILHLLALLKKSIGDMIF